jgi:hypothetical protein
MSVERPKAGCQRRTDSYIHHYTCTQYRKYGTDCDHANRVLARTAEAWLLGHFENLVLSEDVIERVIETARRRSEEDLKPTQQAWSQNRANLEKNQSEIDTLVSRACYEL